jgi:hypothetical protein
MRGTIGRGVQELQEFRSCRMFDCAVAFVSDKSAAFNGQFKPVPARQALVLKKRFGMGEKNTDRKGRSRLTLTPTCEYLDAIS